MSIYKSVVQVGDLLLEHERTVVELGGMTFLDLLIDRTTGVFYLAHWATINEVEDTTVEKTMIYRVDAEDVDFFLKEGGFNLEDSACVTKKSMKNSPVIYMVTEVYNNNTKESTTSWEKVTFDDVWSYRPICDRV